jgi:ketosteroid isomerase-like protein
MIRKTLLTIGLLALAARPLRAQDSATVAKAVNDLEGQWAASMGAKNWAAVQSFLTADYVATDGDGKRSNRDAYIAGLRDGGMTFSNVMNGAYQVLVSGGTAVHLGEGTYTATGKDGKVTRIHTVWTDTWVRQANGQWLCIAGQYVDHKLK